ncbi:SymE family type I addiction module toxin [Xanthomonas vasicola]|uniref:SymE family type I addiction module toxin n=1 Tax=Xanthomonas vasicola TaxID=56459 RepID=UPI001E2CA09A|nr:SymE family type I addiction module toxin [Xanthomonas vasicola]MDO6986737.1 SymE family type I addiction module toxin [Xanthomonas vasicola]
MHRVVVDVCETNPHTHDDTRTSGGAECCGACSQTTPPRRVRPTQQCTRGYGYYPDSQQPVPALRLRGRWLEKLGFAIGSKLRITVRDRELVIRWW